MHKYQDPGMCSPFYRSIVLPLNSSSYKADLGTLCAIRGGANVTDLVLCLNALLPYCLSAVPKTDSSSQ
jgi:hypothetical protein